MKGSLNNPKKAAALHTLHDQSSLGTDHRDPFPVRSPLAELQEDHPRERESRLIGRAAGLGYGSHWRTQTCLKRFWNPCRVGLKTSSTASSCPTNFNMKLYCREGKASISSRSTIDLWRHCVHTMRPNVHSGQSCQSYQTERTPDPDKCRSTVTSLSRRYIHSQRPSFKGGAIAELSSCYGYRMMQFDIVFL